MVLIEGEKKKIILKKGKREEAPICKIRTDKGEVTIAKRHFLQSETTLLISGNNFEKWNGIGNFLRKGRLWKWILLEIRT